ncbi:hypothetical protein AX14_002535 [Amanita brunnescens Koide BX004]|nr:hypothetical protein AX14_002535 [Amanita brunnescens Koide BX004]
MLDYTLWDLLAEQDEPCASTSTAVPLSFSDNRSSTSVDTPLTPPHNNSKSIHVVCDIPLVAPIPLPCYYPSFLRYEPPDTTPYTCRAPKRKRGVDEFNDDLAPKRRFTNPPLAASHHVQRSRQRRRPAPIGDSGPPHKHV